MHRPVSLASAALTLFVALSGCSDGDGGGAGDGGDPLQARVLFVTTMGNFTVETDPEHAQRTVENFLQYVDDGFYAGTIFHRIVDRTGCGIAVVQGGGMTADGQPKQTRAPIALEATAKEPNVKGSLSMARTSAPDSATSQFFVNMEDNPSLDASAPRTGYAVFAHVVDGMENLTAMTKVAHSPDTVGRCDWRPRDPIVVQEARRL